ncbi:hypothetical protein L3X09_06345 [Enterococcus faecium]|nr:hypothetical protein [Enterococcus faecium]
MMAVLSLQGLKNVTFVSSISLLIVMGVPVTDTFLLSLGEKQTVFLFLQQIKNIFITD